MTAQNVLSKQYCDALIAQTSSSLNLSLSEVKEKYSEHPLCIIEYIEKEIHEKYIKIRLGEDGITLACTFDDDVCSLIFMFADNNESINLFVDCLTENYDYDFVKSRFSLNTCFLQVQKTGEAEGNMCLAFYK